MNKKLFFFVLLIFSGCFTTSFSQQNGFINGNVTDNGTPLPDVSVQNKKHGGSVLTNSNGRFSIAGEIGDTLVFSYVGFLSKEVSVTSTSVADIALERNDNSLQGVVVVGYATQKKTSLTSAVADIRGEDLNRRPVGNATQALQGLAAGVTVIDAGGSPGLSNATVRIRGLTTLSGNDPLIMIDGIEQRLQDINPNDIESVTVLKDAASTAIYGSRGANGVILITTRRGKTGKVAVNLNSYYAIQKIVDHPEHMGTEDYMRMLNVAYQNAGEPNPRFTEEEISNTVNGSDRIKYPLPNDWYNVLFSAAPQQNHTLTISGGSEQIKTLLSLNYFDQDGIIPNSHSKQNNVRLNTDYRLSKKITLSGDLNYRLKNSTSPLYEGGYNRAINGIFAGGNFVVPRYPDGTYGVSPAEAESPLMRAELDGKSRFKTSLVMYNLKGEVELIKGLKFQTQYGVSIEQFNETHYKNEYQIFDYYDRTRVLTSQRPNSLTENRNSDQMSTWNNLLTYELKFRKHSASALFGYSQIAFKSDYLSASRNTFYNNDVQAISQGSLSSRNNTGFDTEWGLRSYFGRLNYNYEEKYFFEVNARNDGSSRFIGKNKYGFFPSFSGAWRLSRESFWEDLGNVVDEFKIRGSWGQTGNHSVGLYSYLETLSALNYTFGGSQAQGIYQPTLANKDLTWETTTQTNFGLDAVLWKGKLGVTFDYYNKQTEGILLYLPIPNTIGLNAPPQNAGNVENKGWELSLSHKNIINKLRYSISFNVSDVQNKIISLAGTGPYLSGSNTEMLTIRKEGFPIDAYMGYRVLGLFQTMDEVNSYPLNDPGTQPGDLKYEDINKDGQINTDDLVMVGSAIPHYTFGLNMNFEYQNFDLNLFFQGVGKSQATSFGAVREGGNWEGFTWDQQKDYWTPTNTGARFPRPESFSQRNDLMSDYWMINTAYLKLKNLQIGYTFPKTITRKFNIQALRVYLIGTNLFTISEATKWGLDPEFPSSKLNYYPQVSLYTFGINLTL